MDKDNTVWMPYKDYLFQQEWYRVAEVEWWETGGLGYEKIGIRTDNYEIKQRLRNGTWVPDEDLTPPGEDR